MPRPPMLDRIGTVAGIDLNDGHLAVRALDTHGHPVGAPARIEFALTGTAGRRDAQVRHAITRAIHWTQARNLDTIAVEDLNFADARETMVARTDLNLVAVKWGGAYWAKPYNITRHGAAATVIGRRAQRHRARRRVGVTRTRPEDQAVRATALAVPKSDRLPGNDQPWA